jgi:hypothetical protein
MTALGALEDRRGFSHAILEFGFHSRLDVDLRDFGDHALPSASPQPLTQFGATMLVTLKFAAMLSKACRAANTAIVDIADAAAPIRSSGQDERRG